MYIQGMLFSHKKEGNLVICDHMNGIWGHYPELITKKKKKHCMISFTCETLKKQNSWYFQGLREWGKWGDIQSVQFSRSVVSDSLGPHKSQHTRPPCPSPTPGVHSDSRPSSQWSHPLSSPSPPAPNPSQHQSLFQWVNSSHEVAKVLEFQL